MIKRYCSNTGGKVIRHNAISISILIVKIIADQTIIPVKNKVAITVIICAIRDLNTVKSTLMIITIINVIIMKTMAKIHHTSDSNKEKILILRQNVYMHLVIINILMQMTARITHITVKVKMIVAVCLQMNTHFVINRS